MAANYYINELPQKAFNNKYVYLDSIDGELVLNNNKWKLDLNYYLIMDASLPMNMLNTTIYMPFADIEDISLNQNNNAPIPNYISDKQHCHVYQSSQIIDIGDSNFFDQQLTNYLMNMRFTFDYDSNVINNTTFNSSDVNTQNFINEWIWTQKQLSFLFTNYLNLNDDSGWFDNGNKYLLSSIDSSSLEQSLIFYELNQDMVDLKKPITNLLSLKCDNQMMVGNIKFNFFYTIGSSNQIYQYTYSDNQKYYGINETQINFNVPTSYDVDTHNITTNINGTQGFFIPENSTGYVEIELQMNQNDHTRTYVFNKSFNFIGESINNSSIYIKPIFIQNPNKNFERMVF